MRATLLLLALLAMAGMAWARNAPDFTLPDSDGRQVTLSNYRGKYVVVEMLLPTCPVCQAAGKVLQKLQLEFPTQLQVLGVATQGGVVALADYRREHGITYPVLQGSPKVMMDYMGRTTFHVPAFFLISPSGQILQERDPERIADRDFYANPDRNLETMIRQALPPKKAPAAAGKPAAKTPPAKKLSATKKPGVTAPARKQ